MTIGKACHQPTNAQTVLGHTGRRSTMLDDLHNKNHFRSQTTASSLARCTPLLRIKPLEGFIHESATRYS